MWKSKIRPRFSLSRLPPKRLGLNSCLVPSIKVRSAPQLYKEGSGSDLYFHMGVLQPSMKRVPIILLLLSINKMYLCCMYLWISFFKYLSYFLLRYSWHEIVSYLRCTLWWFDIHVHCERILPFELINISINICVCTCVCIGESI